MQLDNTASPNAQTPQLRYASLHRTIEKGEASDEVWNELARICLVLGFDDEALKAYYRVKGSHTSRYLEILMARHGLISVSESSSRFPAVEPSRYRHSPSSRSPSGSYSSGHHQVVTSEPRSGLREQLGDAFIFLFVDHMPLTIIVATLTFPLVVGLGGFLTAGSPVFLLPLIALLPGLSVIGVLGAMGRRIMIEASQGIEDAPPMPELGTLLQESRRFLLDMLILLVVFVGPGTAMLLVTGDVSAAVGSIALGMLLLPMAVLVRQLSDDWRALSPSTLFRAISKGGIQYLAVALIICLLMLPAFVSAMITMGSHVYLQISVIGPLLVVPLFLTCRLLGRFFHIHHEELADLVGKAWSSTPAREVQSDYPSAFRLKTRSPTPSPGIRRPAQQYPARQALGAPSHPESRVSKPRTSRPQTSRPTAAKPGVSKPGRRKLKRASKSHPKVGTVVAGIPSHPDTAAYNGLLSAIPEAPSPVITHRGAPSLGDQPDLSNIPGARVIKSRDRERSGAASSKRQQW